MKTKTKISKQIQKKTNPELVETVLIAKKEKAWLPIASAISTSRRNLLSVNLNQIATQVNDNEVVVVPGKVLSQGELNKKVKVVALNFSKGAEEKLKEAKLSYCTIKEEIKNNKEAKGVKLLK
jgi:large subunit ribosomal protein L18e